MQPIVIILITYQRTDYALRTIDAAVKHLKHIGGFSWYVCDDASDTSHFDAVINKLKELDQHICGSHSEKLGYGGGVNKAWRVASQTSAITLWLEDDWEIRKPFHLTPYYKLLCERNEIGMIRLAHIPKGQTLHIVGHNGIIYGDVDKKNPFVFSGNPHLKHDKFMLVYGDYPTGLNPGDTESTYNYMIQQKQGPKILWPLSIGDGWNFHHIGTIQSYD